MLSFLRSILNRDPASKPPPFGSVVCDQDRIQYIRTGYPDEIVNFTDLSRIEIVTTDLGPFQEDVFFIFTHRLEKYEIIIPHGAKGIQEMLSVIGKLDGFDDKKVIEAMGSTDNARFICYTK